MPPEMASITTIPAWLPSRPAAPARPAVVASLREGQGAAHDHRWPVVAAALRALRARGRHAVRIVDVECGAGSVLLHALRYARAIGFTAIEGRGIDRSPTLIGRARAAAGRRPDVAIGVVFDVADPLDGLADEVDWPADILLWHGPRADAPSVTLDALRRAGDVVIGDGCAGRVGARAA